jgi:SAM-dependent methyltransferase
MPVLTRSLSVSDCSSDRVKEAAMDIPGITHLTSAEVTQLDPYAFLAVLGKRVIHPGGRRSSEELFRRADFRSDQYVLDVGCGVGTSTIAIARQFGAKVTAVDISPIMLSRARSNVQRTGLAGHVTVTYGDILALDFPDNTFDRVVAEAVTMFVDRPHAVRELIRVCKPGGRVLATEFFWRQPPTAEAREVFLGQVCPGMQIDTLEEWVHLYEGAGLSNTQVVSGPFEMMTPAGFLSDEGVANCLAIMGHTMTRLSYLRKMAWLMPRLQLAVPYLGYILVVGEKPASNQA